MFSFSSRVGTVIFSLAFSLSFALATEIEKRDICPPGSATTSADALVYNYEYPVFINTYIAANTIININGGVTININNAPTYISTVVSGSSLSTSVVGSSPSSGVPSSTSTASSTASSTAFRIVSSGSNIDVTYLFTQATTYTTLSRKRSHNKRQISRGVSATGGGSFSDAILFSLVESQLSFPFEELELLSNLDPATGAVFFNTVNDILANNFSRALFTITSDGTLEAVDASGRLLQTQLCGGVFSAAQTILNGCDAATFRDASYALPANSSTVPASGTQSLITETPSSLSSTIPTSIAQLQTIDTVTSVSEAQSSFVQIGTQFSANVSTTIIVNQYSRTIVTEASPTSSATSRFSTIYQYSIVTLRVAPTKTAAIPTGTPGPPIGPNLVTNGAFDTSIDGWIGGFGRDDVRDGQSIYSWVADSSAEPAHSPGGGQMKISLTGALNVTGVTRVGFGASITRYTFAEPLIDGDSYYLTSWYRADGNYSTTTTDLNGCLLYLYPGPDSDQESTNFPFTTEWTQASFNFTGTPEAGFPDFSTIDFNLYCNRIENPINCKSIQTLFAKHSLQVANLVSPTQFTSMML